MLLYSYNFFLLFYVSPNYRVCDSNMIYEIIYLLIGFSDFLSDFVIPDFAISSVWVGYFWFIRLPLSLSCAQSLAVSSATCLIKSRFFYEIVPSILDSIINVSAQWDILEL